MLNVHVENNERQYQQMFKDNGWGIALLPEKADLIQLVGGADVSPSLYGENKHPTTHSSVLHDTATEKLYQQALLAGIPIAGICRGSQFLSVMGGGKLWQDVDGHATGYGHSLLDIESGMIIEGCSSTHHQQHRPASNAIIIAESFPQLCTHKSDDSQAYSTTDADANAEAWLNMDVEAFYYKHTNSLGFQPHPEFFHADHPCQMYYFDIIAKYLGLRA